MSGNETYELMFPKGFTEEQIKALIEETVAQIEQSGKWIVGAEPIQEVYVKITGRRFTVEDENAWDERQKAKKGGG